MKKVNKLFAGLVGIAATASMAYAAVSAAAPELNAPMRAASEATVSWSLRSGLEDMSGTSTSSSLTIAANLGSEVLPGDKNGANLTKEFDGTSMSSLHTASNVTLARVEGGYIEFTVTPTVSFTPSNVSFEWLNKGFGDGRLDVVVEAGDVTKDLAVGVTPVRDNATDLSIAARTLSYNVSGITATAENPLKIRIYPLAKKDLTKLGEYYIANMVVKGSVEEGEGGDTPVEPDHFFTMPGTFPVPESATTDDNYDFSGGISVEGNEGDKNFCSAYDGRSVTFKNVYAKKQGTYNAVIPVDYSYGNSFIKITVADAATGVTEAVYDGSFPKNSTKWEPIDFALTGTVTEGLKNVTFAFALGGGDRFAGNFKAPEFVWTGEGEVEEKPEIPAGYDGLPGTVHIISGKYSGGCRLENSDTNVGYVKNGAKGEYKVFVTEEGVYSLNIDFYYYSNAADVTVTVTDEATGNVEVSATQPTVKGVQDILLAGKLTAGKKMLAMSFASASTGYLVNWRDFSVNKVGDKFAQVSAVTAEGQEATVVEGYDWAYNIPFAYDAATLSFKVDYENAVLTVKEGENVLTATDGVYTIATPARNEQTEVTLSLATEEGVFAGQTEYKVRFFHLGDVVVSKLTLDGEELDVLADLNNSGTTTVSDRVYTALPKLAVTFADGSSVEGKATLNGTTASYTFTGKLGDLSKDYTVTVEGIHIYDNAENDLSSTVRYDSAGNGADNTWTNGLYTIKPVNDGWGGTQFKFNTKNGNSVHIDLPSSMKVKKIILSNLFDNYAAGRITSVTCENGTVWMPTASSFGQGGANAYNLVCVVENHSAGAGFDVTFEGGNQPVWWWDFVYEEVIPEAPAPKLASHTATAGRNHTVVALTFDREMKDCTVDFNGTSVTAYGGEGTLYFPLWDMEYDTEYTLTIPAGALTDKFGTHNTDEVAYTFTTGSEPVAEAMDADRFTVVSNADELKAAVAALSATNSKATDALSVIYLRNGDYDLGADTNGTSTTQALHLNKLYNVALIGESEEGVLIHGTRYGISYAVLSTRYSTNIYMENLTIRNDADFGGPHDAGVAVAHYGGNLDIMRNVTMQSHQDTEVTGEKGYYYNCTFYGKTDYVCGGGDHYYDNCHFIMTEAGGVITAPSTMASLKHGYVMVNCDISGEGSYYLGRPWQNEPRNFWLNTTMHTVCEPAGWRNMSNVPTHFFEYGSVDGNGNPVDLSKRTNSPTSTNTYSPILDAKYVPYFTHRNVLGYKDSWDAKEHTAVLPATEVGMDEAGNLHWNAVKGAAAYLIFRNGEFVKMATGLTCEAADLDDAVSSMMQRAAAVYTVAPLSATGVTGEMSEAHKEGWTGVEAIDTATDADAEYFNLQGIRVANPESGLYIRRQGNSVSKVYVK